MARISTATPAYLYIPSGFPGYYGCNPHFFSHVSIICGCPYFLSREDGKHRGRCCLDHSHARSEQRHPCAYIELPGPTSDPFLGAYPGLPSSSSNISSSSSCSFNGHPCSSCSNRHPLTDPLPIDKESASDSRVLPAKLARLKNYHEAKPLKLLKLSLENMGYKIFTFLSNI